MAQNRQVISSSPYPYVPIRVQIRDWEGETLALLDTGYDGELIVPVDILNHLDVPDEHTNVQVADNRIVDAPVYLGVLEIVGLDYIADVYVTALADEYILGRGILDSYRVTFDHGERVIIEP